MRRGSLETVIGALVVFVAIIFAVFASKITDYGRETGYLLFAEFNNIGSIKMEGTLESAAFLWEK